MEFAKKLRNLIRDHRLSQETLAQQVGVSQNLISLWCRGKNKPDLKEGMVLARIFGVDLHYLADDDLDEEPRKLDLTEDEKVALDFYRILRREDRGAEVIRVLSRMAIEGGVPQGDSGGGGPARELGPWRDESELARREEREREVKGHERGGPDGPDSDSTIKPGPHPKAPGDRGAGRPPRRR